MQDFFLQIKNRYSDADFNGKFDFFRNTPRYVYIVLLIVILLLASTYIFFIGSLSNLPLPKTVNIKKGLSMKSIGILLEEKGVVPSGEILTTLVVALGYENKVVSGPYYFEKKEGVAKVFKRIVQGDFKTKPFNITFPEGFNVRQVSERLKARLVAFDTEKFTELAKDKEGYLFPQTYNFMSDDKPEHVLEMFRTEFERNLQPFKDKIIESKKNLNDIIIMASVVEKEVRSLEDKKIVAGIFYKRISVGMPLQADATLTYERGLGSADLSTADLRRDSPYNTYTNKGLPPTPISNPGLNAITAAVEPTPSPYLYFLTDVTGKVHYAKTFEEHVRNKNLYIY